MGHSRIRIRNLGKYLRTSVHGHKKGFIIEAIWAFLYINAILRSSGCCRYPRQFIHIELNMAFSRFFGFVSNKTSTCELEVLFIAIPIYTRVNSQCFRFYEYKTLTSRVSEYCR